MQAIETSYKGHRFRSRLEARWAVALDSLGIRWEYERQGYLCSPRLSHGFLAPGERAIEIPYLPDFWLPDHELHAEVKATMTDNELLRLLDCAASLSSNDGGGCHDAGGHDLVVLGCIPLGETDRLPTQLHMHKGDLVAYPWLGRECPRSPYDGRPLDCIGYGTGQTVAADYGGALEDIIVAEDAHEAGKLTPARLTQWLTRGSWGSVLGWDERFQQWWIAYDRARRARFEFGEQSMN